MLPIHISIFSNPTNNDEKICAESILEDWKGFIDEKGKVIDATVENKIEMLVKYEKLMLIVLEASTDQSNFKTDDVIKAQKDTEKN